MPTETILHRLDPSALAVIKKQCAAGITINSNTTPLQAGFQLGVQHVINVLQEGFTTARTPPKTE